MTRDQAIRKADQVAKRKDEMRFVVFESGEYQIATEFDLDTWFAGISDRNIVYCTADRL